MQLNRTPFLLLIFISTNCFPQSKEPDITNVTKVTFFNPGVSYEKRIGQFQSLYAQAFMSTSFAVGFSDAWDFHPVFTLIPPSVCNTDITIIQQSGKLKENELK